VGVVVFVVLGVAVNVDKGGGVSLIARVAAGMACSVMAAIVPTSLRSMVALGGLVLAGRLQAERMNMSQKNNTGSFDVFKIPFMKETKIL
jgi:hypothetical protein